MSTDQEIIADGHVKRQLLRDFAVNPDAFDDDDVEAIWQHLDVCEHCMADYEAIQDGRPAAEDPEFEIPVDDSPADGQAADDATGKRQTVTVSDDDRQALRLEIESAGDAVFYASKDTGATPAVETATAEAPEDDAPVIEGLITGVISHSDEPAEKIDTETLADIEESYSRERIQVSMLKTEPPVEPQSEPPSERARASVAEPDPVLEAETEPAPVTEPEPEAVRKPAARTAPADRPTVQKKAVQSRPPRPRPAAASSPEPLEQLIRNAGAFLKNPRNAIVCAGGLVVVAAVILGATFLLGSAGRDASPVAGWEPLNIIETRVPLQEVLIRRARNGRIPAADGTDVTLDFRGVNTLVIAVDLDFVRGSSMTHEVSVLNPAGETVFNETVPQIYIDDGRFFLRLLPKLFETGETYTLELLEVGADGASRVVAESLFDVLK